MPGGKSILFDKVGSEWKSVAEMALTVGLKGGNVGQKPEKTKWSANWKKWGLQASQREHVQRPRDGERLRTEREGHVVCRAATGHRAHSIMAPGAVGSWDRFHQGQPGLIQTLKAPSGCGVDAGFRTRVESRDQSKALEKEGSEQIEVHSAGGRLRTDNELDLGCVNHISYFLYLWGLDDR